MREIKFRAWDSCMEKMNYPSVNMLINSYDGTPEWAFGFNAPVPMPNCEVMQYTGLKDKNGKEIYEGDIVKMSDDDDGKEVCEVRFINGGFIVEWDSNFAGGEADLTTVGWAIEEGIEIEVIGNIKENYG